MSKTYYGYGCGELFTTLNIRPGGLHPCCRGLGMERQPLFAPFTGGLFPKEEYLSKMRELMRDNRNLTGDCRGCQELRMGEYPTEFSGFKLVVLNHFTACNCRCYYCGFGSGAPKEKVYNPIPMLRDLKAKGLLAPDVQFNIGGGELSIHEYLPEILDFFLEHSYRGQFCTNALRFSEELAEYLRRTRGKVNISLDSGTRAGFEAVKGLDRLAVVSENILKYAEVAGIILKYIVNPRAASEDDIQGFVTLAGRVGAEVIITPEIARYGNSGDSAYWRLWRDFAAALYGSARRRGLSVSFQLVSPEEAGIIRDAAEALTAPGARAWPALDLTALTERLFSGEDRNLGSEDLEEYAGLISREIGRDPDRPQLYRLLLEIRRRQGRSGEMIEILTRAADDQPEGRGEYRALLGQALAHSARYEDALVQLEAALKAAPDHLGYLYTAGCLRLKMGDFVGVKAYLDRLSATEERTGLQFKKRELLAELARASADWAGLARLNNQTKNRFRPLAPAQGHLFRQGSLECLYGDRLRVEWGITTACNYNCSYCFNRSAPPVHHQQTWEEMKKIADLLIAQNRSCYDIRFVCGESTLHPHLGRLMSYLLRHIGPRAYLGITSNGSRGAGYFEELLEALPNGGEAVGLMVSIHTEYATVEQVGEIAERLADRLHLSFMLMFHPGRQSEVRRFWEVLCEVRNRRPFFLNLSPLLDPPDFLRPDRRYTADDLAWADRAGVEFAQVAGNSPVRSTPASPWSRDTLFFDQLHRQQRKMIYWPFADLGGSVSELERTGQFNFQGLHCVLGSNTLVIYPNGLCYGSQCAEARRYPVNILHADVFGAGFYPFVTTCPMDFCSCYIGRAAPKFQDQGEALMLLRQRERRD